jgi:hypothetical protein
VNLALAYRVPILIETAAWRLQTSSSLLRIMEGSSSQEKRSYYVAENIQAQTGSVNAEPTSSKALLMEATAAKVSF